MIVLCGSTTASRALHADDLVISSFSKEDCRQVPVEYIPARHKRVYPNPSRATCIATRRIMEDGTGWKSSKLSRYLLYDVSILNYDSTHRADE